jgi:hypothetical protein
MKMAYLNVTINIVVLEVIRDHRRVTVTAKGKVNQDSSVGCLSVNCTLRTGYTRHVRSLIQANLD